MVEQVGGHFDAGYTIRHNVDDDPNVYGQAPDIQTACVLAAALYARTGYDLRIADEAQGASTVAWVGRQTDSPV